jgi:hypothetical protein
LFGNALTKKVYSIKAASADAENSGMNDYGKENKSKLCCSATFCTINDTRIGQVSNFRMDLYNKFKSIYLFAFIKKQERKYLLQFFI